MFYFQEVNYLFFDFSSRDCALLDCGRSCSSVPTPAKILHNLTDMNVVNPAAANNGVPGIVYKGNKNSINVYDFSVHIYNSCQVAHFLIEMDGIETNGITVDCHFFGFFHHLKEYLFLGFFVWRIEKEAGNIEISIVFQ